MKFSLLAAAFEKLEATSSRLEMTDILAGLFKAAGAEDVRKLVYLLQGRVAPAFEATEIGIGEKFVEQAIAHATGYDASRISREYRELGDLGLVAEKLMSKKAQRALVTKELTVSHVFDSFHRMATSSGQGSQEAKIKLLTELLNNASAQEAKYLVRIPLGRLRLGVGDPTVLDAFSVREVGDKSAREALERAYNLCSDLGLVASVLWSEGLDGIRKFKITVGKPIRPALAERMPSAEDIIKKLGKCAVDAKYDGFRLAVHKDGQKIELFSRNLENTTAMFPEIVAAAKKLRPAKLIFEGEALSYNEETGEYHSFQETMQRKRKHGVKEMAEEFPLRLFAFDLLYEDGKDMTELPYAKRRQRLEKIVASGGTIVASEQITTDSAEELDRFFNECISRGLEGVIAKDLGQPYIAGARKFAWIKLKRSYRGQLQDTIDVVIAGYYRGRGSRARFGFGGFLGCVYDAKSDMFKTVAKCGSGFSEEQMAKLKQMLDSIRLDHKPGRVDSLLTPDVWVEPRYVVTLTADEITESPTHTCGRTKDTGYALRFPRMVSWIREDKKPEDATTVAEIIRMFKMQKKTKLEG